MRKWIRSVVDWLIATAIGVVVGLLVYMVARAVLRALIPGAAQTWIFEVLRDPWIKGFLTGAVFAWVVGYTRRELRKQRAE